MKDEVTMMQIWLWWYTMRMFSNIFPLEIVVSYAIVLDIALKFPTATTRKEFFYDKALLKLC